jgi:hypothetical protein
MPSGLKLAVLGNFKVFRDGQPVPLPPSKKTRALLAYLAVVGRPQRRERLCEIFWEIPDDPRGALRWSLSRIRKILGTGHDSCVRADRNYVSLDPTGFDCDFRSIATLKPDHLHKLDTQTLEAIADTFQGGFFEDLYLPNCPEFEAWRVAHADQAEVLRLRMLRLLVDRTCDQPDRALRHALILQALAPDAALCKEIERIGSQARQLAAGASADDRMPASQVGIPPSRTEPSGECSHAVLPRAGLRGILEQVRKQVSVLATEIVTPFQDLQEEDPEAGLAVLNRFVQMARCEVQRFGGTVITSSDASHRGPRTAGLPHRSGAKGCSPNRRPQPSANLHGS